NPPFERFGGKLRIIPASYREKGTEDVLVIDAEEAVREGIIKSPWLAYWMCVAREFVKALGVDESEMVFEEKLPHERAHYATQTFDQLVKVSRWGWIEVSGHAYRGDYDLSRHIKYSGQDLRVFRRYETPVIVRKEKVIFDKALIGKLFKSKAKEVMKLIESIDVSKLKEMIKGSSSSIILGGYEIPVEAIKIVSVEEKVSGEHVVPHVAEPSFGAERLVLVVLDRAYTEDEGGRIVLKLPPRIAPIKVAVFPLVTKEPLVKAAREVYESFLNRGIPAIYDETGSIGRRYARADEIGVPYAITIDYQTLEDSTVTIRFRDTRVQIRVSIKDVVDKVINLIEEGL
ncbi:MAG: glycine--tRNA ligase, partial [Thermoprotei archaeon]